MKTLRSNHIVALGSILVFATQLNAQCGATDVNPSPYAVGVCEGDTAVITFEGSGTCAGTYEYEVTDSLGNVVQAWSTMAEYSIVPAQTMMYFVSVRCDACPTTVVMDTFLIELINQPVISGETFLCYGMTTTLTASGNPSGTVSWWDAPSPGTQVSPSEVYTTGPLTAPVTYYAHATGSLTGDNSGGSILITECGLHGFPGASSADYIEVSNLYDTSINTTGWVVAVSNSYTILNSLNPICWYLPNSFSSCSVLSKTDVFGQPNYWGNNIYWNPGSNSWAIIIDDVGNVVDFCAWGWTAAELAGFNVNINGFNITLGTEWTGDGCNASCNPVGMTPYSISRTGSNDNNVAGDFVCQATSLNTVNPGLVCGWITSNTVCVYPVDIVVDLPPTASNPIPTNVACYADVPAPNTAVVTDELDDFSVPPTVTFMGEVSSGTTCPEIITRTYRVEDSCLNFIDVTHTITIHDVTAPVIDPPPFDITISCMADIPPMIDLNYTDNCDAPGTVTGVDISDGNTCPETITRSWTVTDNCGNTSTVSQIIVVHDFIPPAMATAPADVQVTCYADIPAMIGLNWFDNCDGAGVHPGNEVTDGNTCPETFTRTWTHTDGCGNSITETQIVVVHDDVPPMINPAPADVTVQCYADIPAMVPLAWSDNCDGAGILSGTEVSDGQMCPETLTRTWTYSDGCGNTATETQTVIIHDTAAPTASPLPTIQVATLPAPDPGLIHDAADNCTTPTVVFIGDSSDEQFCPETVTRTYMISDDCGNQTFITQNIIVGDRSPEVSFIADPSLLTNLMEGIVEFTNTSAGAVAYIWDFDDGSASSNEVNPTHDFTNDETASHIVQLTGISEFNCTDTFAIVIQIQEELIYYTPNTFTPDGDDHNQTFLPVFESRFDPYDYNFKIFNRWGELIFESFDHMVGWDGTYSGRSVQQGSYIWKIEFGDEYTDGRTIISGHLNLIR